MDIVAILRPSVNRTRSLYFVTRWSKHWNQTWRGYKVWDLYSACNLHRFIRNLVVSLYITTWFSREGFKKVIVLHLRETFMKYANVFLWGCFLVYGKAPNEILNNNRTWNFYSLWTIVNFWIRCKCGYCSMMTVLAISKGYPVCSEAQPKFLLKQSCHCNLQYFYARSCCPNMYFYVLSYLSG